MSEACKCALCLQRVPSRTTRNVDEVVRRGRNFAEKLPPQAQRIPRGRQHDGRNGSPETTTALEAGYYSGLITCEGDADFYLIMDINVPLYIVEVYGEEGRIVGEYDTEEEGLYEAPITPMADTL